MSMDATTRATSIKTAIKAALTDEDAGYGFTFATYAPADENTAYAVGLNTVFLDTLIDKIVEGVVAEIIAGAIVTTTVTGTCPTGAVTGTGTGTIA